MKRNLAVFFAVVVMILAALVGIQMRLPRVAWTRKDGRRSSASGI